jgi:hypothetical protein
MKTMLIASTAVLAASFAAMPAVAGGWGYTPQNSYYSSGLVNVSPNVRTGDINLLNGTQVLNASPILSGNSVLNGNRTSAGNGILGGTLNNLLSGNNRYSLRGRR